MEAYLSQILGAIGVIILTVILGFISKRLDKVLDNQTTQGTDLAVVKSELTSMRSTVMSLHEWRNRMQEAELENLRLVIQELKHPTK